MKATIKGSGKVELHHDRICVTSEKTRAFVKGNASEGKISVQLEPENTVRNSVFNVMSGNVSFNGGLFVNGMQVVGNLFQGRGGRVIVNGVEITCNGEPDEDRGFEFGTISDKDACFKFDRETVPLEKLKTKNLARVIVDRSVLSLACGDDLHFSASTASSIVIATSGEGGGFVGGRAMIDTRTQGTFDGLGAIDFERLDAKASTQGSITGLRVCKAGSLKSTTQGRISVRASNSAKVHCKERTQGSVRLRRDE